MVSEVWWLGVKKEMCLQTLDPGELRLPARNPDTHLFRSNQDQGSAGHRCGGDDCGCGEVAPSSLGLLIYFNLSSYFLTFLELRDLVIPSF